LQGRELTEDTGPFRRVHANKIRKNGGTERKKVDEGYPRRFWQKIQGIHYADKTTMRVAIWNRTGKGCTSVHGNQLLQTLEKERDFFKFSGQLGS